MLLLMAPAFAANAIIYTYGNLNKSDKTCTLMSWSGQQPTSGKLVLKETYEENGVTYKVTAIAPHALDNLTEVTEITIPANVMEIGDLYGDYLENCLNFYNCPKLKAFKVAQGSEFLSATGAGILMRKGGKIMVRVPEGIELDGGVLNMSKSTVDICPDAFAGNQNINTVALSPNLFEPLSNCGFNDMRNLREFRVNGEQPAAGANYSISNGILLDRDGTRIISYPPAIPNATYTVPAGVTKIGKYAFANTISLMSIDWGDVTEIGEKAFYNCGLTSLELPNREMSLDRGVFSYSQKLSEMTIPYTVDLPEDFVRNSYHLKKVYVHSSSTTYGDCAFKHCASLDNFNFSPDMTFDGDSIFANCGFKEVTFGTGAVPAAGVNLGFAMFDSNPGLEKVDLSGLVMYDGNGVLGIRQMCFSQCTLLRELYLPRLTWFWAYQWEGYPNIGYNSELRKIVMGAFSIENGNKPALIYGPLSSTSPSIYLKTTDALEKTWPLCNLISIEPSSTVRPVIFCEGYTLADAESGDESEYVLPGAIYYIPGGCGDNYKDAKEAPGCQVIEMFDVVCENTDGTFSVHVKSQIGSGIDVLRLNVNNSSSFEPEADGWFRTGISIDDVENYDLEYNCNDVLFRTKYPKPILSGVEEIGCEGMTFGTDEVSFGATADYTVVSATGATAANGRGESADLSGLEPGVYIVSATYANGKTVASKLRK